MLLLVFLWPTKRTEMWRLPEEKQFKLQMYWCGDEMVVELVMKELQMPNAMARKLM